jgi:hypothetical protein
MIRSIGSVLLLVTVWLWWQAAGSVHAQENPRLATLEIDIWPDFDQPAALVILRAEIAANVNLPAAVSLRIPSSSGGPAALAYSASADGQLLNLDYERSDAQGDFITLTFSAPERFFQLEFYDPMAIGTVDRSYTYTWPGGLAVDQLSVELQEPATATDLSVQPELGPGVLHPDGLLYREAGLGASDVGQTLTIDVSYKKTDARTSAEILGLETRAPQAEGTGSEEGMPFWLLVLVVLAVVVTIVSVAVLWRWRRRALATSAPRVTRAARRREQAAGRRENATNFCPQCGTALRSRDRFCPECGAAVRRS